MAKCEYIRDESLAVQDNGECAHLDWFPVVPGTLVLKFGSTPVRDDGHGSLIRKNKHFGRIFYPTGKILFDQPISTSEISADYDFDSGPDQTVEMKLTSVPVKAKAQKLEWKPKPPTGPNPIDPGQYLDALGVPYNKDGVRAAGYLNINVLEFLWGRKLDEVVMAYVHALRPSKVRITEGMIKLNCCLWRVTIYIDKKGFVTSIQQEVEVLLPEGVAHGDALRLAKEYGVDSPLVKWHQDARGYAAGLGGYGKYTKDGYVRWKWKKMPKRPRKLWRKIEPDKTYGE